MRLFGDACELSELYKVRHVAHHRRVTAPHYSIGAKSPRAIGLPGSTRYKRSARDAPSRVCNSVRRQHAHPLEHFCDAGGNTAELLSSRRQTLMAQSAALNLGAQKPELQSLSKLLVLPSDRKLGLTLGIACLVLAGWLLFRGRGGVGWVSAIGGLFLVLALVAPVLLRPVNIAWMKLGMLLNAIVSPVVLGIVFFGLITPIALFMRVRGRDALRLRVDPEARTYWVSREPPGPDPVQSFPQQF